MPHVILEHTKDIAADIDRAQLLRTLHLAVIGSGLFSPDAVKSRRVSYDAMLWGEKAEPTPFAHLTVRILAGRTPEQRSALSQSLFDALKAGLPDVSKLSVEIHDMDKESYRKT